MVISLDSQRRWKLVTMLRLCWHGLMHGANAEYKKLNWNECSSWINNELGIDLQRLPILDVECVYVCMCVLAVDARLSARRSNW